MNEYIKVDFLGEGTYAVVYKAIQKSSGRTVAIKKFRMRSKDYGIPINAVREIKLMRETKGEHILNLLDCFIHKGNLVLVLEYMENGSLEQVIHDRDIKPNNLLLSSSGVLKLADLGLTRVIGSPSLDYSPMAFADWYRSPEMLFGFKKYVIAADIWATGCVFAELLLHKPIFKTKYPWGTILQIKKILSVLGLYEYDCGPIYLDLTKFVFFKHESPVLPLADYLVQHGAKVVPLDAVNLLIKMLSMDPDKRPSAKKALQDWFFYSGAQMTTGKRLPQLCFKQNSRIMLDSTLSPEKIIDNKHGNGKWSKICRRFEISFYKLLDIDKGLVKVRKILF